MIRVTFSPFTAEPEYVRAVANAVLGTQMQYAMAAWEAQMRFVEALGMAALAAQWSMVERLYQAQTRRV
jgi:hypothetical protein